MKPHLMLLNAVLESVVHNSCVSVGYIPLVYVYFLSLVATINIVTLLVEYSCQLSLVNHICS